MGKECLEFGMQFNAIQIQTMTKYHFVVLFVSIEMVCCAVYCVVSTTAMNAKK